MEYTSTLTYDSEACPGVRFTIRRVSFAARLDLLRRLREHGSKLEYLQGGSTTPDHLESAILEREIEEMLVRWGLASVEHLNIDGVPAEPLKLVSSGPESLVREVASRLRAQLGITEEERKNF